MYETDRDRQGTSGWVIFAAAMLGLGSVSHISSGMTMVFNTTWVLDTTHYTSKTDIQALGWVQLGVGVLMLVSAWGLLTAKRWARAVGVVFGVVTALHGLTHLEIHPLWGIAGLLVGAGIVFALTAKGGIVAEDQVLYGDQGGVLTPEVPPELMELEPHQEQDY
jgi:uncharacterized membrane protein (DUF2068 family)